MMLTKRNQRKLLVATVTVSLVAAMGSLGVWMMNHRPPDTTVEVESFDQKHLGLYWKLVFEAPVKDGRVVVRLAEAEPQVQLLAGHRGLMGGAVPDQTETDSPSCNPCWTGYASVEAKSEPGLTTSYPYTRWVDWMFYPTLAKDGESVVTFRSHIPSDGKDCRQNLYCDQITKWTPYGKWTLITHPFTFTHASTAWGATYQFKEEPVQETVFTVTKP